MQKKYVRTEDWLKALQSVGQIVGEVLKEQACGEKCNYFTSKFKITNSQI